MVVLIDLDGTLTDPKLGITRCVRYAMMKLGREVPDCADLTWCIGPPLLGSFEQLLGNAVNATTALGFYRERFGEIGLYENQVYDGIPAALSEMFEAGHKLYLATSKPTVYARRIIEHFGLDSSFEGICGSELDGTRADKSELIAWILKEHRLNPADSIMIGDRRHDIFGARNNSLRSIGVLYGYGSRNELKKARADFLCSLPSEISGVVAEMQ